MEGEVGRENLGSVDWYTLSGDWAGNAFAQGAVEPEKTAFWSQHSRENHLVCGEMIL